MPTDFKYQIYLNKYKNCPKNCEGKNTSAFRWVHSLPIDNDFVPILINEPSRILDDSDRNCTGYALSLHLNLKSSVNAFLHFYNKLDRPSKRERFLNKNGNFSAQILVSNQEGVCEKPDEYEHFHFFEYKDCNLLSKIIEIFDIFAYNGSH